MCALKSPAIEPFAADFGSLSLEDETSSPSDSMAAESPLLEVKPSPALPKVPSTSPRPASAFQACLRSKINLNDDVPPELVPVFSFLDFHAKKTFVEGYLLKLNDLGPDGRPHPDRNWVEFYAQLNGTEIALWNAMELDAAQSEGSETPREILPSYLNITDANIRMIGTLPTKNSAPLQNILSISTAGQNRILFQFSSSHNLSLWTAAMQLALFEYVSLQEFYTGALIAAYGKSVNNIRQILAETTLRTEGWVRVRFGPGMPWLKYWAVIVPAEKKKKKKDASVLGEMLLFESKKTKKDPIAVIAEVFAAYAVFPQTQALIENSSLVKIHGIIKRGESYGEGSIFFMPDVPPMVRGLEVLLTWLVPVYDTFQLYGRPKKFNSDPANEQSLFFAMPRERNYFGSLEVADVMELIGEKLSRTDRTWRENIKAMIASRMGRSRAHTSLPPKSTKLKWGDRSVPSSPALISESRQRSVSDGSVLKKLAPPVKNLWKNGFVGTKAATRSVSTAESLPEKITANDTSTLEIPEMRTMSVNAEPSSPRQRLPTSHSMPLPPLPQTSQTLPHSQSSQVLGANMQSHQQHHQPRHQHTKQRQASAHSFQQPPDQERYGSPNPYTQQQHQHQSSPNHHAQQHPSPNHYAQQHSSPNFHAQQHPSPNHYIQQQQQMRSVSPGPNMHRFPSPGPHRPQSPSVSPYTQNGWRQGSPQPHGPRPRPRQPQQYHDNGHYPPGGAPPGRREFSPIGLGMHDGHRKMDYTLRSGSPNPAGDYGDPMAREHGSRGKRRPPMHGEPNYAYGQVPQQRYPSQQHHPPPHQRSYRADEYL